MRGFNFIFALLFTLLSCLPAYTQTITADKIDGISSVKNLVKNAYGEKHTVGYVKSKNTSAAATPDSGFVTTSLSNTFAVSATTPIEGAKSFLWTLAALGEQVCYPFTIDNGSQGDIVRGSLDYAIASGTFADDAATVWIYYAHTTTPEWIQPSGYLFKNHTLKKQTLSFDFQARAGASAENNYKLCLHQAAASTAALRIDNVQVGPQVAKGYGNNFKKTITTYTSGSGTYTVPSGAVKLVFKIVGGGGGGSGTGSGAGTGGGGGNSTINTTLLVAGGGGGGSYRGSTAAGSYTITSPAVGFGAVGSVGGMWNDPSSNPGNQPLSGGHGGGSFFAGGGRGGAYNDNGQPGAANTGGGGGGAGNNNAASNSGGTGGAGGSYVEATILNPAASYTYAVGAAGASGSAGTSGLTGGAGGSGVIIIEEYYAGSQIISTDSANGVVIASGQLYDNFSSTNPTMTKLSLGSQIDKNGAVDVTNDQVNIKTPGTYIIGMQYGHSCASAQTRFFKIAKNGSSQKGMSNWYSDANNHTEYFQVELDLVAGDYITFLGATDAGATISNTGDSYFSVKLLQGPSQILASADVSASYQLAGAVSISTTQPVNYATKIYDSHGAVTTGASWKFTAPISGLYNVSTALAMGTSTCTLYVYKGGSAGPILGTTTTASFGGGSQDVRLLAGEYIDIRSDAGAQNTNSSTSQTISIKRVGQY